MPDEKEGILDKVKEAAEKVTDKVKGVFQEHGNKIDDAVDKTGDFVDEKTKGKFSEHIDKVQDVAHGAVDKLSGEGSGSGEPTSEAPK